MLELARKRVFISESAMQLLLAAGSLASFGWLLLQDQIHPLIVYFLQFYLTF